MDVDPSFPFDEGNNTFSHNNNPVRSVPNLRPNLILNSTSASASIYSPFTTLAMHPVSNSVAMILNDDVPLVSLPTSNPLSTSIANESSSTSVTVNSDSSPQSDDVGQVTTLPMNMSLISDGTCVESSKLLTSPVSGGCSAAASRLTYISDRHSSQSLSAMNGLRKQKELCDIVLLVGDREIFAHRIVLAASSSYFRAMFTGEMAESRQTEVTLYDLNGDALEQLVDFCYTGHVVVEETNVQNLLPAACLLQLTEVQDVCCEFLKRQLDPSNCLGIRAFADTHACHGLLQVADRFTQMNFLDVVESEEFLLLSPKKLADILISDELNVRSEEQVYRAVMRWLNENLPDRLPHLSHLMQHVRLPLLSPKFLVGTVSSDALIRSDETCRDLVDEAKNYLLLPQERPLMQGPRTRPRRPVHSGELLFAVGGWCSGDAIASAERFDPVTHEWNLVAPMHKRRCGVGVGVINDLLYAVGGHDGQSYLNSVERYDPHTNQWSSDIAPTSTCRTSVGVAALNGLMYAVGGQDGVTCLNFVERFDPAVNKWTKVCSMASRRLGVGVAVLNGQLYAVGGSDGQQPLSSVEHYDPRVGAWFRVACMGTRRKHLGVAVHNGFIYAVGGRDEATELSSAEYFDPRTRSWYPVVAMTARRSGVGLAVVNDQLIAIGGFDGSTYLKTVEIFDPDANCWRLRGTMNSRRLGGGVGVVRLANSHSSGLPLFNPSLVTAEAGMTKSLLNGICSTNPHHGLGMPIHSSILTRSLLVSTNSTSLQPPGLNSTATSGLHRNSQNSGSFLF